MLSGFALGALATSLAVVGCVANQKYCPASASYVGIDDSCPSDNNQGSSLQSDASSSGDAPTSDVVIGDATKLLPDGSDGSSAVDASDVDAFDADTD